MSVKLNRLLSKIIPPITASAGGCEYERWCKVSDGGACQRLVITFTNGHTQTYACGSC